MQQFILSQEADFGVLRAADVQGLQPADFTVCHAASLYGLKRLALFALFYERSFVIAKSEDSQAVFCDVPVRPGPPRGGR